MAEITETRLAELLRTERKMQALETGGVDNWEWYGESLKDFHKEEDKQSLIYEAAEDLVEYITTELSHDYPAGIEASAGYYFEGDMDSIVKIINTLLGNVKELEGE